jgi:hypothetical protein
MAEVHEFFDDLPRHQAEGTAGKLQGVNVSPHRFQYILQITLPHGRLIGSADFSQGLLAGFGRRLVHIHKGEGPFTD